MYYDDQNYRPYSQLDQAKPFRESTDNGVFEVPVTNRQPQYYSPQPYNYEYQLNPNYYSPYDENQYYYEEPDYYTQRPIYGYPPIYEGVDPQYYTYLLGELEKQKQEITDLKVQNKIKELQYQLKAAKEKQRNDKEIVDEAYRLLKDNFDKKREIRISDLPIKRFINEEEEEYSKKTSRNKIPINQLTIKRFDENRNSDRIRPMSKSVKEEVYRIPSPEPLKNQKPRKSIKTTEETKQNVVYIKKSQLKNLENIFQDKPDEQKPLFLKNRSVQTNQNELERFQSPKPAPSMSTQTITYPSMMSNPVQYPLPASQIQPQVLNPMPFLPQIVPSPRVVYVIKKSHEDPLKYTPKLPDVKRRASDVWNVKYIKKKE